jgi:uncharacterized protein
VTRFLAVLWLALFALATPVSAQTFPKLTGRVVDEAHLLRPEQVLDLSSKSEALEAQTGRQFVIATVPSLEGRTIEDYGYRLGRAWAIGRKGQDDGVILLVAPNERKVRIETGYGARVFLTDAVSSVIIREAILPRFKAGDYGGGIEAGANEIITQMSLPPEQAQKNIAAAEQARQKRDDASPGIIPVIFWMVIILVIIGAMSRGARGRRYRTRGGGISPWIILWGLDELSRSSRRGGGWGGGSWGGGGWGGGGGGFSGGGGSFGGGGASGSW